MIVVALCGCGTITTEPTRPTEAGVPVPETAVPAVPGSPELAAIAPGTAELMARIRATDACSLLNREFADRLGTFRGFDLSPGWHRGGSGTGCGLLVTAPENPDTYYAITVELGKLYTADKRVEDRPEIIGARTVYRAVRGDDRSDAAGCEYRIPAGDTGFAHQLGVTKMTGPDKTAVPWPQPCQFTKDYLAEVIDGLLALPPRVIDAPAGRSLVQRDPCAAEPQITRQFFGWQTSSIGWSKPYKCAITLIQPGGAHRATIEVSFERNIEQMVKTGEVLRVPSGINGGQTIQYGRHLNLEGYTGTELRSVQSTDPTRQNTSCAITVNFRRADPPAANNAHLVRITLSLAPPTPPFPFDACAQAGQITPTVLHAIP